MQLLAFAGSQSCGHCVDDLSDFSTRMLRKSHGMRSEAHGPFAPRARVLSAHDETALLQAVKQHARGLPRDEHPPSKFGTTDPRTVVERLKAGILSDAEPQRTQDLIHALVEDSLGLFDEHTEFFRRRLLGPLIRIFHVNSLTHSAIKCQTLDIDTVSTGKKDHPMTTTGPTFVSFQVRDTTASARFYEDLVGLKRLPVPTPAAVVFSAGNGVSFAVREPFPSVHLDAAPLGRGIGVWFHNPDAAGIHKRLAESGVPITQEPFEGPFGLQFAFRDPDGYTVTIHATA